MVGRYDRMIIPPCPLRSGKEHRVNNEKNRIGRGAEDELMTIRIFVSHSHLDDARRIRLSRQMAALEREKDVVIWFDGDIEPGLESTPTIRSQLRQTDIFLAFGSSNYLHSDYCYRREYRSMRRKSKQGRPRILVALVGIYDWPNTEMARSKMLPDDARSVEENGRPNRAYLQIVQGLAASSVR